MLKRRIGPKRKLVQWVGTLLLLAIPFLRVGGDSLLRLDAGSRTLLFFGAAIRIEEFYLFLILVLIVVFGFLLATMILGRVWCGWLCPQTVISDLARWVDLETKRRVKGLFPGLVLRHLFYLALSFLVASNLIWYFIPPALFFQRLITGELGAVAGISLTAVAWAVYLDLALVRERFCKLVCPYGRIQHMTMDANTLTLELDRARAADCIRCGSCTRVCPMAIDIREGLQIECINCGRCLDACRDVMEKRDGKGLIRYVFGPQGSGTPLNARTMGAGLLLALLVVALGAGIASRKEATVKVQRGAYGEVKKMDDGSVVNFYSAFVENRGTRTGSFTLVVVPVPGRRSELIGPVRDIVIGPNGNKKVDFAVKVWPGPEGVQRLRLQVQAEGHVLDATPLPVLSQ